MRVRVREAGEDAVVALGRGAARGDNESIGRGGQFGYEGGAKGTAACDVRSLAGGPSELTRASVGGRCRCRSADVISHVQQVVLYLKVRAAGGSVPARRELHKSSGLGGACAAAPGGPCPREMHACTPPIPPPPRRRTCATRRCPLRSRSWWRGRPGRAALGTRRTATAPAGRHSGQGRRRK